MTTLLAAVEWILLVVGVLTGLLLWRRYPDSDAILLRVPFRQAGLARFVFLGLGWIWVVVTAVLVVMDSAGIHASDDASLYFVLGCLFLLSTYLGLKTLGLAATADSLVWGQNRIPWTSVKEMSFVPGRELRIATDIKAPKTLRDPSNPTVWCFPTVRLDFDQDDVTALERIRRRVAGRDQVAEEQLPNRR